MEYRIDLDTAEDYDPCVDFPEIINWFHREECPIRILQNIEYYGFRIGETVTSAGRDITIEYFGILDFDNSALYTNNHKGAVVAVCNESGYALVSELIKND